MLTFGKKDWEFRVEAFNFVGVCRVYELKILPGTNITFNLKFLIKKVVFSTTFSVIIMFYKIHQVCGIGGCLSKMLRLNGNHLFLDGPFPTSGFMATFQMFWAVVLCDCGLTVFVYRAHQLPACPQWVVFLKTSWLPEKATVLCLET